MTVRGAGKIRQINVISRKILVELEDGIMFELNIEYYNPDMLVKK